jgi:uncharacterized membrane protein
MLFLQFIVYVTVLLDIPVARQIIGFFYFAFIPGIVIIKLLRLNEIENLEMLLFSTGISIAFLILVGLLLNELGPLFGLSRPLSTPSLLVTLNSLILAFAFLACCRDNGIKLQANNLHRLFPSILPFILIPILSVVGVFLTNVYRNNLLLVSMIVMISLMLVAGVSFINVLSPKKYPLVLFTVAIALLLSSSLFSSYIHGGDIFGEYAVFRLTTRASHWNPAFLDKLYTMLSVTILPTIYSNVLGIDGTWIFKIIYPLIFAFVPLGLYQLFKSRVGKQIAFFSVFFFMSNLVFFTELVVLARQMIGELFYILLFLTIFNRKISGSNKWLLFAVFGFGIVVSHYAMSYIFLALISALWAFCFIRKRRCVVSVGMVLLLFTMAFAWYIHVSSGVIFDVLSRTLDHIFESFVYDFLNPQSRGSQVLQGLGIEGIETFWHFVGRYIYYTTELLILIGVIGLLIRERLSFFNDEYNVMVFLNLLLILACIIVPNLATTFNMTRFYHVALFFLSPFCVLGGIDLLGFLSSKRVDVKGLCAILVLVVLIPFFLFQTGFVYELTGEESWSLPLSGYRFDDRKLILMGVLRENEVFGARWLSAYQSVNNFVYADLSCWNLLTYGEVKKIILSFNEPLSSGSYVFVRSSVSFNSSSFMLDINETNVLYSSGSCEIFKIP